MVDLCCVGPAVLQPGDVRSYAERERPWIFALDDTGLPFLAQQDGLRLAAPGREPTGLALVARNGRTELSPGFETSPAVLGWVEEIWRRPCVYRLRVFPWRQVLSLGAPRVLWTRTERVVRAFSALSRLRHQLRRAPTPEEVEAAVARRYAAPERALDFGASAYVASGLSETERRLVSRLSRGASILDVGCGTGREAIGFARLGLEVTAVDVCPASIEVARREAEKSGVRVSFAATPISRLDFARGSFDAVFLSSDVYAEIPGGRAREATLERFRGFLGPGGVVMIPANVHANASRLEQALVEGARGALALLGARVPERGDRWRRLAPEDAELSFGHVFHDEREVLSELESAGFELAERISSYFVATARPEASFPLSRFRRAAGVTVERAGDELVLVDVASGEAFRLNGSARAIFELAGEGATPEEIASRLHASLGVEAPRLERDAKDLVQELARNALLEPALPEVRS